MDLYFYQKKIRHFYCHPRMRRRATPPSRKNECQWGATSSSGHGLIVQSAPENDKTASAPFMNISAKERVAVNKRMSLVIRWSGFSP